jgi:GH15 family glucan-1,4-alpha-glucosidase
MNLDKMELEDVALVTETLSRIQGENIYRRIMTEVTIAERRNVSEQQILDQLILALVMVGLSYGQDFKLIKTILDFYQITVDALSRHASIEA